MVAQRPQVAGLPVGPGADDPVPLADLDLIGPVGVVRTRRPSRSASATSPERDRPLPPVEAPQLLEDLPRLLDPVAVPLDADLAVAGQDLHPQGVADLPEVLVSAAEDRELFVVIIQTES